MAKRFFLILLSFTFFSYSFSNDQKNNSDTTVIDTISIIGVGDIMMGSGFPSSAYLPPNNNCEALLSPVIPILKNADVTFGNLEGSFSDNCPLVKKCKNPANCYAFRMPTKYADCINKAGFDLLSIANNHAGDFGQCALDETMAILDSFNIKYAGLITNPITVYEKDSIKYGFCAFSPNIGTCSISDYSLLRELISQLKNISDIIIVSFHGGAEGAQYQHVTKSTETFYGENRGNVYEFAHIAIDAGADVIFGHGPHVTRAIELYKNRFIIYSLGNFCTYGRFNLAGPNGIAPIIKLNVTPEGEFLSGEIIPINQINNGFVTIDKHKSIIFTLNSLTKIDFPNGNLKILNDGTILKK